MKEKRIKQWGVEVPVRGKKKFTPPLRFSPTSLTSSYPQILVLNISPDARPGSGTFHSSISLVHRQENLRDEVEKLCFCSSVETEVWSPQLSDRLEVLGSCGRVIMRNHRFGMTLSGISRHPKIHLWAVSVLLMVLVFCGIWSVSQKQCLLSLLINCLQSLQQSLSQIRTDNKGLSFLSNPNR